MRFANRTSSQGPGDLDEVGIEGRGPHDQVIAADRLPTIVATHPREVVDWIAVRRPRSGRVFGFQKVRYRGLAKNLHRLQVTAALTNLFMVRRRLLGM
jgi:IS5 family transposase